MRAALWWALLALFDRSFNAASGHGYLHTPIGRGSIGYPKPINDNHMGNNCGGIDVQKSLGGKCGVCGDPFNGPRRHEAGGDFAKGVITGKYKVGATIPIKVHLTANHKGWFEFRICPVTNAKVEVTQQCLNQRLLKFVDGKTRRTVLQHEEWIDMKLQLPSDLACPRCVLQWKYHAGNNVYGCPDGTDSAKCGAQEEFYNCADVSISGTPQKSASIATVKPGPATVKPGPAVAPKPTAKPPAKPAGKCVAIGIWAQQPDMFTWCVENCPLGNCPPDKCAC